MTQFLDAITSWWSFLLVLVVFGFAPRFVLRFIVLAFHREDPRRRELLAEIHGVPRLERPVFVFEQLERALVEGLVERLVWTATGRIIWRWRLDSGVRRNRETPDTFDIPSPAEIAMLRPGWTVKLLFQLRRDGWEERMWVEVAKIGRRGFVGYLSNTPAGMPRPQPGQRIRFRVHHIAGIWPDDETLAALGRAGLLDADGNLVDVPAITAGDSAAATAAEG